MLIRTMLVAAALSACVTTSDPDAPVAQTSEPIICGPFCDPGHDTYDDALYGAYDYGLHLFSDATRTGQDCYNVGPPGAPEWDCLVTFTTDLSPCKNFIVECLAFNGHLSCNHRGSNCQF
jgi:hypothetical protein